MLEDFTFWLGLVVAIVLIIMLANKIKVAYPVLLIVAGLFMGFIPGFPLLHIEPELIFIIFLPPLLYASAWAISWKELWRWRRVVGSFAFVMVFLTALSVAVVANHFIPGFSLALGFLLGGIVSPPDAVSAGAILKFVTVPRRISSILEGESLLNDASSLIIFRFALIAVATGQFIWTEAALSFSWMLVGGIGIGLLIGLVFMKLHRYLPTDENMDIVLSIVAPYIMYICAEQAHGSGVLAVVSGGLFLSKRRHFFLSSTSRVHGVNVWESFCFVLNGLVFILIGLALPEITAGLGEGVSVHAAIGYGILVTMVLIVGRILSAYGAVIFTLLVRNFIKVADRSNPGLKAPLIIGWTGMRGVVSLAAALSIPVHLADGSAFPHRNLILFITFVVILLTLLLQGLTLPYIIRKLDLFDPDRTLSEREIDNLLSKELADLALLNLRSNYSEQLQREPILQLMERRWQESNLLDDEDVTQECKVVYLDILNQQRQWLIQKNKREEKLDETVVRKHLHRIDMEEEKLRLL